MGGWTSITVGRSTDTSFFSAHDRVTGGERLAAVVVRRFVPRPVERGWIWKELLRLFRPRRPPPPPELRPLPEGFNSSTGSGPQEILFSETLGLVRTNGRDFPLPPDGRTLVLLLDDRTPNVEPTIATHAFSAPVIPRPTRDPSDGRKEFLRHIHEHVRLETETWRAAIDRDPVIRAFRDARPSP
jgi:hypothetical protein